MMINILTSLMSLNKLKNNDYFETQQFPTSAASIFEMSINNWLNLKLSDSKIIDFVTPKKLMEKNLNS